MAHEGGRAAGRRAPASFRRTPAVPSPLPRPMDWHKRFKSKACLLKLKATSKEEALIELADHLVSGKILPKKLEDAAKKALADREELASTGVGMNVAIPHVAVEGLDEAIFSLSLAPDGLDWQAVDGEPVQIVFLVLRPEDDAEGHDPEEHIEVMRWVAGLARDADFRGFALQARTKAELLGLLKEMAAAQG